MKYVLSRWPKNLDREETIRTGVPFAKETLNGNLRRWYNALVPLALPRDFGWLKD